MIGPRGRVPDPERLQQIVDGLVEDLQPRQIILFGSAARGEMTDRSDIDVLVVCDPATARAHRRQYHTRCPRTGATVDVLVMPAEHLEAGRFVAADVRQEALEDGLTLYAAPAWLPVRTGPPFSLGGFPVVRSSLLKPVQSRELLAQAEDDLRLAEYSQYPPSKCMHLQSAAERALKALIAAQGLRFDHVHDLSALWDAVAATGETLPGVRDDAVLSELSDHAGDFGYTPPSPPAVQSTWEQGLPITRAVVAHARQRVPVLVARTQALTTGPRSSREGDQD